MFKIISIILLFLCGLTTANAQLMLPQKSGVPSNSPINGGAAAAKATAENNPTCTAIEPFYIEIGNASSGGFGTTNAGGGLWNDTVPSNGEWTDTTPMLIASASKWQYGMLVVAERGGLANLNGGLGSGGGDIAALTFTDGYANMGSETAGTQLIPPAGLTPFTASIGNNATTWHGNNTMATNQAVTLSSSGTFPTGFNNTTTYYTTGTPVTSGNNQSFVLSTTPGGSGTAQEATSTYTGTISVTVVPNFSCAANPGGTADSVNFGLPQCGVNNTSQPNSYQYITPGTFDYDSGHMEVHASNNQTLLGIANLTSDLIYIHYVEEFKTTSTPAGNVYKTPYSNYGVFTEPMIAGAIYQEPLYYSYFLQTILNSSVLLGSLAGGNNSNYYTCAWTTPRDTVGQNLSSDCPTAYYSPLVFKWNYALGHWWEVDPSDNDDWSVSSPGAYGFYPWIQPLCPAAGHPGNVCTSQTEFNTAYTNNGSGVWSYYGFVARQLATGSSPTGNGTASHNCALLVRTAWLTGVANP